MIYHVRHATEVNYAAVVKLARFNLRLKPVDWSGQQVLDYRLTVEPLPAEVIEGAGPFAVNVARLTLDKPLVSLKVTSEFTVAVDRMVPDPRQDRVSVESVRRQGREFRGLGASDPASYLFSSPIAAASSEIAEWAAPIMAREPDIMGAATALMHAIHGQFAFDRKATKADTPPLQAFEARRGVCQDFTHIMIIALRQFGIPAAYVSGYLRTRPPPGKARLIGADATHAWVNVWCGTEMGWVGFDPTNAVIVGNDHIFVAMGRDYGDVSPLDGVFIGGSGQSMKVSVEVALVETQAIA